jgi:hypothetical protein
MPFRLDASGLDAIHPDPFAFVAMELALTSPRVGQVELPPHVAVDDVANLWWTSPPTGDLAEERARTRGQLGFARPPDLQSAFRPFRPG